MKTAPPRDETRLFLIRHGATEANRKQPYILQGRGIDLPLNELGQRQAEAVAQFLIDFQIDHVYCSRLQRAVDTATHIAGPHGLEVQRLDDLAECDVGQWEGMDWASIERDYPEAYRAFMSDPGENPYLGGESYGQVLARVRPVFRQLMERHAGEAVIVVGHNVVNRVVLADLLGLDMRGAKDVRQTNACVNVLRYRRGKCQLMTMNADFHLDDSLR